MSPRPATVRDVARRAGVSTATVSRVLNSEELVAEETRDRVKLAIEELGYNLNQVARSLKTRATRTVGVIAPELASDFFMLLAESLERELSESGYSILVCSSRETVEEESRRLTLFEERLVDAIVVIPSSDQGRHFRAVQARGTPLVLIDRLARGVKADAVLVDNSGGARQACEALIADGYSRIGFVGGDLDISTARERYEGYRAAMAAAGLAVEADFTGFGPLHIESGYSLLRSMLRRPDAPEAYFIVNADTHIGATNYLMTEGTAFRDRVVFAAFDEMPYSPLLQFCRYSVAQPIVEMGREAARLVLGRLGADADLPPRILRLPTRLIPH